MEMEHWISGHFEHLRNIFIELKMVLDVKERLKQLVVIPPWSEWLINSAFARTMLMEYQNPNAFAPEQKLHQFDPWFYL